jgi:hypothetical protein
MRKRFGLTLGAFTSAKPSAFRVIPGKVVLINIDALYAKHYSYRTQSNPTAPAVE